MVIGRFSSYCDEKAAIQLQIGAYLTCSGELSVGKQRVVWDKLFFYSRAGVIDVKLLPAVLFKIQDNYGMQACS